MSDTGALKARYENMAKTRSQYLQRARHNALLTVPALMPMDSNKDNAHLIEPYQGLGAQGVIHLSSRLATRLLPAGRPHLRLDIPPKALRQLNGEVPSSITIALSKAEQAISHEVEAKEWRKSTLMSLQQLLVAGNVLEYVMPDNRIRCYRLDQYVVRFDIRNTLIEVIIRECFPRSATPIALTPPANTTGQQDKDEELELYTHIEFVEARNEYVRTVEWGNGQQAMKPARWSRTNMPYIAVGWSHQPGEDYARSKVEEHIADLRSLDALEKAQIEMAGMASRNFIMIRPGAKSQGLARRLTRGRNGDVLIGDPESVELKSFDNAQGYQLTTAHVAVLRESLSRAFLLQAVGQRDAERVTATEIERDIAELEAALGGVFSNLSNDMMKRRTELLMQHMAANGDLPDFEGQVEPTILTGLEALSRERDVSRAMQAGQIVQAFGPEAVDAIKLPRVLGRAFVGIGIPDAVRTEEEVEQIQQQRQQAAQEQAAMEKLGPEVVRQVGQAQQEE